VADAYTALRGDGAVVDPRREALRVSGPEATSFLQGQCSQDVAAVAPGASVWSWVLQPTGKVEALIRLTRTAGDAWILDTDIGWADAVVARLTRFRLRTKVDIELTGWRVVGVRGRAAATAAAFTGRDGGEGGVVVAAADWPGLTGVDLLGPSVVVPAHLPVADAAAWEAARIEAGIPVMGAELTERTIPGETGLIERTVSFTKGCYTGQELVARIDSRGGHVARHLTGLLLAGPVAAGTTLSGADGLEAGTLTSVAHSPSLGPVGLGIVRRSVATGDVVDAGGVAATVASLPLTGA
jgi:folate-binding protein YgfZ